MSSDISLPSSLNINGISLKSICYLIIKGFLSKTWFLYFMHIYKMLVSRKYLILPNYDNRDCMEYLPLPSPVSKPFGNNLRNKMLSVYTVLGRRILSTALLYTDKKQGTRLLLPRPIKFPRQEEHFI